MVIKKALLSSGAFLFSERSGYELFSVQRLPKIHVLPSKETARRITLFEICGIHCKGRQI